MVNTDKMKAANSRGELNRDHILDTAIDLADRDGLAAVTMRGLAAELAVQAMSLYHYFPNKEALFDGLVDRIAADVAAAVDDLPETGDWRRAVRQMCLAARLVMLKHPWAPGCIASRTRMSFSLFRHYDAILGAMIRGGLSYHLAHRAMHSLGSMALGFVQELFSPSQDAAEDVTEAAQEAMAQMASQLPHISAMVASEIHAHDGDTLGWCDSQAEFEFTLDLLLDGLERLRVSE